MKNRGKRQVAPGAKKLYRDAADRPAPFQIALDVFDGPFSLLLSLIQKHELDITDVSLSLVTDEFITYIADFDDSTELGLDRASEFLEVAATLLDLKITRLLPQGEPVGADDIAVFEARDLLFARLLQYRAFAHISSWFSELLSAESHRHVRSVALEPHHRESDTKLVWALTPQEFAALAVLSEHRQVLPEVDLTHMHVKQVSLREQTEAVVALLQQHGELTFGQLTSQSPGASVTVARFLALLELYRRDAVRFTQPDPLGELHVTWVAEQWHESQLLTLGENLA